MPFSAGLVLLDPAEEAADLLLTLHLYQVIDGPPSSSAFWDVLGGKEGILQERT